MKPPEEFQGVFVLLALVVAAIIAILVLLVSP
jgi:hypothetical protein